MLWYTIVRSSLYKNKAKERGYAVLYHESRTFGMRYGLSHDTKHIIIGLNHDVAASNVIGIIAIYVGNHEIILFVD